jgi:predicted transcriptional regulator
VAARRTHPELKDATRQLSRKLGGNKVAAALLHVSTSQVQRYTDANSPDDIGVSQTLILERAAGDLLITGMLAHLQGAAILNLAHAKRNGIGGRHARACGAVIAMNAALADALRRDPNVSQHDIPRLTRLTHEALSQLSDFLAVLHARGAV